MIDGSETKPEAVKIPADGMPVMIRLSLDQQSVQSLTSVQRR